MACECGHELDDHNDGPCSRCKCPGYKPEDVLNCIGRILLFVAVALIVLMRFSSPAQAAHQRHHAARHHEQWFGSGTPMPHPAGCPRTEFCGCGVSVAVFGHSVRELWLASKWRDFPVASAAPGMVAVRQHHVMLIQQLVRPGVAVVYDPNSGHHATQVHTVSLAGYTIHNPRRSS